jgi:hypothetical protein
MTCCNGQAEPQPESSSSADLGDLARSILAVLQEREPERRSDEVQED